jgi:FixJ family two-component response regulator
MVRTVISCSPRGWMVPSNEMVYIVDDDASVREALSSLLRANGKQVQMFTSGQEFLARYRSLTPREQQVLPLLARGLLNKHAAGELGITEYTVQIHRGHIMRKMEADSFATLVKLAGQLNLETSEAS